MIAIQTKLINTRYIENEVSCPVNHFAALCQAAEERKGPWDNGARTSRGTRDRAPHWTKDSEKEDRKGTERRINENKWIKLKELKRVSEGRNPSIWTNPRGRRKRPRAARSLERTWPAVADQRPSHATGRPTLQARGSRKTDPHMHRGTTVRLHVLYSPKVCFMCKTWRTLSV